MTKEDLNQMYREYQAVLSMSEALKTAWMNIKLKAAMKERIVKFYFQKVDGSIREAYGTLKDSLLPDSKGTDSRKM